MKTVKCYRKKKKTIEWHNEGQTWGAGVGNFEQGSKEDFIKKMISEQT